MIGLLLGLAYVPAEAHCFSQWNYPYPQRCGVYARTNHPPRDIYRRDARPVSPINDIGIPLPDMNRANITWGGAMDTELELELQRQKAIRQLTQQGN